MDCKIRIKSPAGALQAEFTNFLSCSISEGVNEPGVVKLVLGHGHKALQYLVDDAQIEVMLRDKAHGLGWYTEFYGLYKDEDSGWEGQKYKFSAVFLGDKTILSRRHILYYAGTANRSEFTGVVGETMMKTLVSYNAAASATTGNGRQRNGAITGLAVETDGAHGNAITKAVAYDNLLNALQDLAQPAGGDFDLVKTGARAWEFRWGCYHNTGASFAAAADRRTTVLFSLDRGNMKDPKQAVNRSDARSVAIVGGKGEKSDRAIRIVTGPDYSADFDVEIFVNANSEDDPTRLDAIGADACQKYRIARNLSFGVNQTEGSRYAVHYWLGDLVKAYYEGVFYDLKVATVTWAISKRAFQIEVGLVNYG